ncbi:nicotinate phosphoribosyltransferase [Thecamonas trahens ATCC 50062]|uniref:Nicotinate phosphoribosyltransferase n=1 Tax=Thecamonas trahens ATCC 50062 TaxID=461836 RepID=A0A0L0D6M7_THETB|nr:nicotinate phosphoribosyltransferase [Thecamonas trahens ATCC 50062]KNC48032.1 nicotinate phosphoribosyltransferase [Thecamonas trahens ATCC 50062]|eukprot:XP_013759047.1 nicotinate phosphoribosyltransferase [Thecamonas trahens ATCC 50062]
MAGHTPTLPAPFSNAVSPLLNDLYQVTMAYAYFKGGRHEEHAVFDLFFRKHPFKGEFTIFAGLEECLRLVDHFGFTADDIEYIRETLPGVSEPFLEWLAGLSTAGVTVKAIAEGSVVFPRLPLLRISGPLGVCQLLETTLLNLVNYASLMATNAARFVQAAGPDARLLEFGLRRAQGPDGGMSASKYSYMGGFHGTSNVAAGKAFGIPIRGTHAHSFVCSFVSLDDVPDPTVTSADGSRSVNLATEAAGCLTELGFDAETTNAGEFAAFVAYAVAFPDTFLALVDTYSTLDSGVPNFMAVALALARLGYQPRGIRLDSGDLAALSIAARNMFAAAASQLASDPAAALAFRNLNIVASDSINEAFLHTIAESGHSIDTFGIGTNLVTCQAQPALGCVFKLVQIGDAPRIKLSQNIAKVTVPGAKLAYRLHGHDEFPILDVMVLESEEPPRAGEPFLCRHPLNEGERVRVKPRSVEPLLTTLYSDSSVVGELPSLESVRSHCLVQQGVFKPQTQVKHPSPYRVYLSDALYTLLHDLWLRETAVPELS